MSSLFLGFESIECFFFFFCCRCCKWGLFLLSFTSLSGFPSLSHMLLLAIGGGLRGVGTRFDSFAPFVTLLLFWLFFFSSLSFLLPPLYWMLCLFLVLDPGLKATGPIYGSHPIGLLYFIESGTWDPRLKWPALTKDYTPKTSIIILHWPKCVWASPIIFFGEKKLCESC